MNSPEKFYQNGFLIVQSMGYGDYHGVCGLQWPLDEIEEKGLGIPYDVQGSVHVATNWRLTYEYWQKCLSKKLDVQLLLLETSLSNPNVKIFPDDWNLLGYDISYVRGDFYSAIQQEVLRDSVDIWRERRRKLNKFGLFAAYQDAVEFLSARELIKPPKKESFGEFYAVRLSRYKGGSKS